MLYKHIFGPVLSRRLGVSLGVDLVRHKICSMDCIYCECGKTTDLTTDLKEVVKYDKVRHELDHYWQNNDDPDYITFSGSGEPTLNPCLGQVISYIKKEKPQIKVAVLTNSSLFDNPDVRDSLLKADLVVPSLDAVSKRAFEQINRPHSSLDIDKMIKGLETFAREFDGRMWLEVLILPGVNDADHDLELLKTAIKTISPDLVQLNTLDRPGTETDILPAEMDELKRTADILQYPGIEIIAKPKKTKVFQTDRKDICSAIIETIHRRPCTLEDLSQTLGFPEEVIVQHIDTLEKENKIFSTARERGIFYQTIKD